MHKKFIKKKFIVPSIATVLFVNQYNIVYLIETNLYLSSENLPVREIKWDSNWKGKGPILCWDFYQPSNKQTKSTNHNYKNNIGRPAQFSKDKYEKYLNTFSGWLAVPKLPVY